MDSMDQNRQDAVSIQDTEGKDPETTGVPQADHGTDTDMECVERNEPDIRKTDIKKTKDEESHVPGPEAVIEAILFTMGDSVPLEKLASALEISGEEAEAVVKQMMERYEQEDRGVRIIELDGAYQMCTKKQLYEYLIRVASQPKKQILTDVLMETLSIIAYKQPVTKQEIEKIRGVKSDHAVNKLVEYNLVCEVGRLDAPGRPMLFATTEEFLRRFGIGTTEDLPGLLPEQEEEIKSEVAAELQMDVNELEQEEQQIKLQEGGREAKKED